MPTAFGQDNDPASQEENGPQKEPMFNLPPLLKWAALILVLMQLGMEFLPIEFIEYFFLKLAFIPARFISSENLWQDPLASLISPIGHSLLHGNWLHLFSNLGMLLAFGTALHRLIGPERMLLVSAIGSIAGAVSVAAVEPHSLAPMVGASDAISAILGALIYISWVMAKIGIPASSPFASKDRILTFVAIWVGMNFLFILAPAESVGGRVAWEAHLAGFLSGIIAAFCILKLYKKSKQKND